MWRDDAYLLDILTAARRIVQYTSSVTEAELTTNHLLQDAAIRQCIVIGEAARKVSQETKDAHPDIPWADIIGMRNRLIHEYFRINVSTVWDTVHNDIPRLIALLEPLVPPLEEK